MRIFMKNEDGKPSVSLTMVTITFGVIMAWLLFWLVGTSFGLIVPAFDATVAVALLMPVLSLYFGRKATAKTSGESKTVDVTVE